MVKYFSLLLLFVFSANILCMESDANEPNAKHQPIVSLDGQPAIAAVIAQQAAAPALTPEEQAEVNERMFQAIEKHAHSLAEGTKAEALVELRQAIKDGAQVNAARDKDDYSPLGKACLYGSLEGARDLLHAGACLNVFDGNKRTPLMHASNRGRTDIIRVLLTAGADVNQHTHDGLTALMEATLMQQNEAIRLLIRAGANPHAVKEKYHETARDIALRRRFYEVSRIIEQESVRYMAYKNQMAEKLYEDTVATDGHFIPAPVSVRELANIVYGYIGFNDVPVTIRPEDRLIHAVLSHNVAGVGYYVRHGINPNVKCFDGRTLLMIVADQRDPESLIIADLLLEHGADPHVHGPFGRSAFKIAQSTGNRAMLELFEQRIMSAHDFNIQPAQYRENSWHSYLITGRSRERATERIYDEVARALLSFGFDPKTVCVVVDNNAFVDMKNMAFRIHENWGRPENRLHMKYWVNFMVAQLYDQLIEKKNARYAERRSTILDTELRITGLVCDQLLEFNDKEDVIAVLRKLALIARELALDEEDQEHERKFGEVYQLIHDTIFECLKNHGYEIHYENHPGGRMKMIVNKNGKFFAECMFFSAYGRLASQELGPDELVFRFPVPPAGNDARQMQQARPPAAAAAAASAMEAHEKPPTCAAQSSSSSSAAGAIAAAQLIMHATVGTMQSESIGAVAGAAAGMAAVASVVGILGKRKTQPLSEADVLLQELE